MKKFFTLLRFILFGFIILISCLSGLAQDTTIRVVNSYGDIVRSRAWSDMNRVFILTPANPDQSECIYFHNQNTTSAHTFTFTVSQTGDKQVTDFTNNQDRWNSVSVVGTSSPVPALSTTTVFVHANAAAKIAFIFSGSTTQAGSPDNADVWIVQTTANTCGPSLLTQGVSDPCLSLSVSNRKTVPIPAITTATTTQIIALVAGQTIYPCTIVAVQDSSSTNWTYQWEYGTGAACGTGTTVLSGPISIINQQVHTDAVAGPTLLVIPQGNALCILTAGTVTTNAQLAGWVTFIQQ